MKKLLIIIPLVFSLYACGPNVSVKNDTMLCPVPEYPKYILLNENVDNSTNHYIVDKENVAILSNNLNLLKTWAERVRTETIPCYERQVKNDK